MNFNTHHNKGYFHISTVIPGINGPRREIGRIERPKDASRPAVLRAFLSRYIKNKHKLNTWSLKYEPTSTVRWVDIKDMDTELNLGNTNKKPLYIDFPIR